MPPKFLALALVPVFAVAAFAVAYFQSYKGQYEPPPSLEIPFEQITSPAIAPVGAMDSAVPRSQRGLVVVEDLHINYFTDGEISALVSMLANRGHEVEIVDGSTPAVGQTELEALEERLRRATSLAVLLPRTPFTVEEIDLVKRFVEKGGKLLLVSDPTRSNRINELA